MTGSTNPTTMNIAPNTEFNNITDVDLANLLYVHCMPTVLDEHKAAFDDLLQIINTWEAWELTQAENATQQKVADAQLPSDVSVESKMKRMAYRAKVIDAYRTQEPWLPSVNMDAQTLNATATDKSLNLVILHTLLSVAPLPGDQQFTTFMRAIGPGFANNLLSPFRMAVVEFPFDVTEQKFLAKVTTFGFSATVSEVAAHPPTTKPSKTNFAPAPPPAAEKTFSISSLYTKNSAIFNTSAWNNGSSALPSVTTGKNLLPQKQLNLWQGA